MSEIIVEFNGKVYKKSAKNRYYFEYTTSNDSRRNAQQLHRAVWEYYNGPIPKGCHIHHIDGDVNNNDISNLKCLSAVEHLAYHAAKNKSNAEYVERQKQTLVKAVEKAKDWHKSEAGHKWHKNHVSESIGKTHIPSKDCVCVMCGVHFKGFSWSKYCSKHCENKYRWRNNHKVFEPEKRFCTVCGSEYTAVKANSKYCSANCKAKAFRMKHKGVD